MGGLGAGSGQEAALEEALERKRWVVRSLLSWYGYADVAPSFALQSHVGQRISRTPKRPAPDW